MPDSPQVTIVGGGMITQIQLLPTVYHLQREGALGEIHICALNAEPLATLKADPTLARAFPGRFYCHNDKPTQSERPRVNATNARLVDADGGVHALLSPRCKELRKDLEEVVCKKGSTTGDIDKSDGNRTHTSDEFGYYCDYEFPIDGGGFWEEEELIL